MWAILEIMVTRNMISYEDDYGNMHVHVYMYYDNIQGIYMYVTWI